MLDRRRIFFYHIGNAAVVKLADTPDSGSGEATHAGSSPVSRKALPFGKGSFLPDNFVGQKRAGFEEPGCAAVLIKLLSHNIKFKLPGFILNQILFFRQRTARIVSDPANLMIQIDDDKIRLRQERRILLFPHFVCRII